MGKPEEIAAAVLYLASDEAAFVTGTALEIDGGWAVGKKNMSKVVNNVWISKLILSSLLFIMFTFFSSDLLAKPKITRDSFGKTQDGLAVEIFTLENSNGASTRIMTYGGTVVSLKVPDKTGQFADVVLGFDTVGDYERNTSYIGALIGRYGNRIAKGKFLLNGTQFNLAVNNGVNHLHGGPKGYDKVVWSARPFIDRGGANLELTYFSKDREEGYPGNLSIKVIYSLTEGNELKVIYSARSDADTVINLTQHSYFNLAGAGNILDHQLMLNADRFTPTDDGSISTGELRSVKGTPFDFTRPVEIGKRIDQNDEQLRFGKGYDHNWVLNKKGRELSLAATVYEMTSGRFMEVFTTEPGLQFYSGNFLDGSIPGKNGRSYPYRSGFCLEAQHFPDSPNQPTFPTTVLKKGRVYSQTTIYRFSSH